MRNSTLRKGPLKKDASQLLFYVALAVLLMVGMSACDNSSRSTNTSSNPVVLAKAVTLMDALKAMDYEQVIKQYPESYFVKHTPEGWLQHLKTLNEERGVMQSYRLVKSQADTRFSGKFFILEYMAVHEGEKRMNHIITLIDPVDGSGLKIVGHKMTPWLNEKMDEPVKKSEQEVHYKVAVSNKYGGSAMLYIIVKNTRELMSYWKMR